MIETFSFRDLLIHLFYSRLKLVKIGNDKKILFGEYYYNTSRLLITCLHGILR